MIILLCGMSMSCKPVRMMCFCMSIKLLLFAGSIEGQVIYQHWLEIWWAAPQRIMMGIIKGHRLIPDPTAEDITHWHMIRRGQLIALINKLTQQQDDGNIIQANASKQTSSVDGWETLSWPSLKYKLSNSLAYHVLFCLHSTQLLYLCPVFNFQILVYHIILSNQGKFSSQYMHPSQHFPLTLVSPLHPSRSLFILSFAPSCMYVSSFLTHSASSHWYMDRTGATCVRNGVSEKTIHIHTTHTINMHSLTHVSCAQH